MKEFFLSWYFVIIFLGSLFIIFTRKSWNQIIKKASFEKLVNLFLKWKNKNQKQTNFITRKEESKFKKLFSDLKVNSFDEFHQTLSSYVQASEQNKVEKTNMEKRNEELINSLRFYMFSYLNLFLRDHSKEALVWFYNHKQITKDYFLTSLFSNQLLNLRTEKEIIFTIFLQHFLITKNQQDLYFVTDLGIDFLKFIKKIN